MENKPECYVPFRRPEEIFSGVPSFLGLPAARKKEDIIGHDFAVMGVPWEGACTSNGITGTENATKTIRIASTRYSGYLPEFDFDTFDHFSACDYGDAAVRNGDRAFTFESARNYMRDVLSADAIPITFGGDHSLSYPLIEAFAEKWGGHIGIIHFDAHLDNLDSYGDDRFARCCPFHRIYEIEGFDPKNLVSIGIRGPRNHPDALREAGRHGASVITGLEMKQKGYSECVRRAIETASAGTKALYVTVCSDALDVSGNPGAAADPCGITTFELSMMLYECGLAGARGFDYMEVYPPQDLNNVSSHVACWMTLYAMNGMARHMLHRKSGSGRK